jgi:hypothetical protein
MLFYQMLDGVIRGPIQLIFLLLILGRLGIAIWKKERNRIWIFYLSILIFSWPIWGLIERLSYEIWKYNNSN